MLRGSSLIYGRLRALFGVGALGPLGDGELLELFAARRDEVAELAFAALVERHGPMVRATCRRILRDPEDAADAFQATFLVLARRASSVRVADSLGRWLHGVSRRVALQAKTAALRRQARERAAAGHPRPAESPDPDRGELLAALDEEVARLPERYRAAVILCDLGGLTHQAAARQLRCPVGTVESRLSRGRALLRARLLRRGLAPAAGLVLAATTASAAVPAALARATLGAAVFLSAEKSPPAGLIPESIATLVKAVERAMLMSRLKIAAGALIATIALGAGAGVLVGQERNGAPRGTAPGAAATREDEGKPGKAAAIASLERRIRALEQRIEEPALPGRDGTRGREPLADPSLRLRPDTIRKVRPRFPCLVEKVLVKPGQPLREGEPLAELFSVELAAGKNAYLARTIQWNHDRRLYELREKLVGTGAISQQLWVDTQNEEERSRHDLGVARDQLRLYGLCPAEIDAVKDEDGERKARFTLRSPADGQVIDVGVEVGDFTDPRSILMLIGRRKP